MKTVNWSLRAERLPLSPACLVENNPSGFPSVNPSLAASSLNSHLCLCKEAQIAPPGAASPRGFVSARDKQCLHNSPSSEQPLGRSLRPGTVPAGMLARSPRDCRCSGVCSHGTCYPRSGSTRRHSFPPPPRRLVTGLPFRGYEEKQAPAKHEL